MDPDSAFLTALADAGEPIDPSSICGDCEWVEIAEFGDKAERWIRGKPCASCVEKFTA